MTKQITENTTIKEFMEWYSEEYDGHVLPSDYVLTIARLDGYRMGKGESEESNLLMSAKVLLQDAQNFFEVMKRYSNWKIR